MPVHASSLPVESSVENLQREAERLRHKLQTTADMYSDQENKYKQSFVAMENKLRQAITNRDELLQLR